MARVMASVDIFIHGCEAETYGMVTAEARASGLPLIVPDMGGAADQALAGAGLHYHAGDAAALARAISTMLSGPLETYQQRARNAAPATPTMDQHFAELSALYKARVPIRHAA